MAVHKMRPSPLVGGQKVVWMWEPCEGRHGLRGDHSRAQLSRKDTRAAVLRFCAKVLEFCALDKKEAEFCLISED